MSEIFPGYLVTGLARGLAILRSFDKAKTQQNMAQIAQAIGVTRSSAYRLVYTLESEGYLIKHKGKYSLGSKVLSLGCQSLAGMDFYESARPIMARLRDSCGMTVHLVVRDGAEVVYVERCQANASFTSTVSVGTRLPAYATTLGQMQMVGLSEDELQVMFNDDDMQAFTDKTPTSIAQLKQAIDLLKGEKGLVSWGKFDPRISICCAPVMSRSGDVVAALSVSCPLGSVAKEKLESEVKGQVIEYANLLSETAGLYFN